MKTLWNALSFLAVVHLLALLMFVGWMWKTGRLDRSRVEAARAIFSPTIADAQAEAQRAAELAAAQQARREAAQRRQDPALSSAARLSQHAQAQQTEEAARRRLDDERGQFLRQIMLAEQQLTQQRDALETRNKSMEEGLEARQRRLGDEQLAKAVKLLEALPPKQAKEKIVELAASGRIDQAVVYLDTMNPRAASKVLAQFKTAQENQLATELLERIRTLGASPDDEAAGPPTDASNAGSVSDTS